MRKVLTACLLLLSVIALRADDKAPEEKLPDGYRRLELKGIIFYLREGQEDVARKYADRIAALRKNHAPLVKKERERLAKLKPLGKELESLAADGVVGAKLLKETYRLLGDTDKGKRIARETWGGLHRVFQKIPAALEGGLDIVSLDRIKIVSLEDLRKGRVPYFSVDEEGMTMSVMAEVKWDMSKDGTPGPYRDVPFAGSPLLRAMPLFEGKLPDGSSWEMRMAKLTKSIPGTVDEMMGNLGIKEDFDRHTLAFFLLHEAIEFSLVRDLAISDPLARWMHDGMANYMSERVIASVMGKEAAAKVPYGEHERKRFEAAKKKVRLLDWARLDIEKRSGISAPEGDAHYFWATHEIRALFAKQEPDFLPYFLDMLREAKPVVSLRFVAMAHSLTSHKLHDRLKAYAPQPRRPEEEIAASLRRRIKIKDYRGALPDVLAMLPHYPGDPRFRLLMIAALVAIDPVKHSDEIVRHALIGRHLTSSMKLPVSFDYSEYLDLGKWEHLRLHCRLMEAHGNLDGAILGCERALFRKPEDKELKAMLKRLKEIKAKRKKSAGEKKKPVVTDEPPPETERVRKDYSRFVNQFGEDGECPLIRSARIAAPAIANLLLERGAKPNAVSRKTGETSLIIAAGKGNTRICNLLLKHGADVNVVMVKGEKRMTALDVALKRDDEKVISLLRDAGAKKADAIAAGGK